MQRSSIAVAAFAAALLLAGCASQPGAAPTAGVTEPGEVAITVGELSAQQQAAFAAVPDTDGGVAGEERPAVIVDDSSLWLMLGGSGSCPPVPDALEFTGDAAVLTIRTDGGEVCTMDYQRYPYLVTLDQPVAEQLLDTGLVLRHGDTADTEDWSVDVVALPEVGEDRVIALEATALNEHDAADWSALIGTGDDDWGLPLLQLTGADSARVRLPGNGCPTVPASFTIADGTVTLEAEEFPADQICTELFTTYSWDVTTESPIADAIAALDLGDPAALQFCSGWSGQRTCTELHLAQSWF